MHTRRLLPAVALLALVCAGSAAGRAGLDRYGGWIGTQLSASGWFRTQKLDGRWWLVDPEGHPFRSAGVEGVTTITGAAGTRDPYRAAISEQYGGLSGWAEHSAQRLSAWGFNTVGAGSDDRVCRQGLPYVVLLDLSGRLRAPRRITFVDVFSPAFARQAEQTARRLCRRTAADPLLLGYLTDDGLPWGRDDADADAVFGQYLGLDDRAPGRVALVEFLESRYLTIDELNDAWRAGYQGFDEIGRVPQVGASVPDDDAGDFLTLAADRYFLVTAAAVRAVDANHLVFGCRLATAPPAPVLAVMHSYVDVVAVSGYGERPPTAALRRIHRATQLPILIAGFTVRARDSGLPNMRSRGPMVETQEERGEFFARYVEEALSLPMVVGYHWYQHADPPVAGGPEGECGNYGLVTVDDEPYEPLTSAVTRANQGLYTRLQAAGGRLSAAARRPLADGR
jgi:hypothetical protein